MLEKIRALAMEKLASEAEVDAFMEGFMEKAASRYDAFLNPIKEAAKYVPHSTSWGDLAGKAGIGLTTALLGAGIVKGISAISGSVDKSKLRSRFEMGLAQVMSSNRIVKAANPARVKGYAETIFSFAPHVASDPNLLSSLLANVVQGEGVDPMTIKTLVDLEGRFVEN